MWNLFTFLGAWPGAALGDPKQWGLDGAACAAFLGLLWPRLVRRDAIAIAVCCAAVTIIATPFAPIGTPLLIAALVAIIVSRWIS